MLNEIPEMPEGFDDVEISEDGEDLGESSPQKAEAEVKRPKKVRIKYIDTESTFWPFEMNIALESVSQKEYVFDDLGSCLSWLTRRVYNEETLSDDVALLHSTLFAVRSANKALTHLNKILIFTANSKDQAPPKWSARLETMQPLLDTHVEKIAEKGFSALHEIFAGTPAFVEHLGRAQELPEGAKEDVAVALKALLAERAAEITEFELMIESLSEPRILVTDLCSVDTD